MAWECGENFRKDYIERKAHFSAFRNRVVDEAMQTQNLWHMPISKDKIRILVQVSERIWEN